MLFVIAPAPTVITPPDVIVASPLSVLHAGLADVCAISNCPAVPLVIVAGVDPAPPPTMMPYCASKPLEAIVLDPVKPRMPPDVPLARAVPPFDTGITVENVYTPPPDRYTYPVDDHAEMLSMQVPDALVQFVPPAAVPSAPNDMAVEPPPPDSKGWPDEPAAVGKLKL